MQKQNPIIKNFYQSIKADNIDQFKHLYEGLKNLLLKEQTYKNFLIYALECNSSKILQFLFSNDEKNDTKSFMENTQYKKSEKTTLSFLPLLMYSKQFKTAFYNFTKYTDNYFASTLISSNLDETLFLAFSKLEEQEWNLFFQAFENLIVNKISKFSSHDDNYLFILISRLNKDYHMHLLEYYNSTILDSFNNQQINPFLIACSDSSLSFVKALTEKLNTNISSQFKFLDFGVFNEDINVLKFLLNYCDQHSLPYDHFFTVSPLFTAIEEGSDNKILYLLDKLNDDVSDSLTSVSKHFKNPKSLSSFFKILPSIKECHINKFLSHNNISVDFWSNLFLHASLSDIQKVLENEMFQKSFNTFKSSEELSHYIYNSSIVGRKDINIKIDFLLEHLPILNSEHSDKYFVGKIKNNELYFQTKWKSLKLIKNFSFASSLINLPANQIKTLLENTQVSKHLSEHDFLIIYSLGLYKNSLSLMKLITSKFLPKKPLIKSEFLNTNAFIQNNLISLQEKEPQSFLKLKFKNKYAEIISLFEDSPSNFLSKIAFDLFSSEDSKLSEIKKLNAVFNNNEKYLSAFNNSVIAFLLQRDEIHKDVLQYYSKYSNNISKVCFAKLTNLEKVENFSEKHLLRFFALSFVDPSENCILSEIDLINSNDVIFQNIDTYENIKNNEIFKVFLNHQLKNIQSPKYQSQIIKHYNLRTWSILFSILDSSNPNKNDFIDDFLKITDFNIPTLQSKNKNISINNVSNISHHFDLPVIFWEKLFKYYSGEDNLINQNEAKLLLLNHAASKLLPYSFSPLIADSISSLTKHEYLTSDVSYNILSKVFHLSSHYTVPVDKNMNTDCFLNDFKPLLNNLTENQLVSLLNDSIIYNSTFLVSFLIESKPEVLNKFSLTTILNNKEYQEYISNQETSFASLKIKPYVEQDVHILLKNTLLQQNNFKAINDFFIDLTDKINQEKPEDFYRIYNILSIYNDSLHLVNEKSLINLLTSYYKKMSCVSSTQSFYNHIINLSSSFLTGNGELFLKELYNSEIKNILFQVYENNKSNDKLDGLIKAFRELDLKEKISSNSSGEKETTIKTKKKL